VRETGRGRGIKTGVGTGIGRGRGAAGTEGGNMGGRNMDIGTVVAAAAADIERMTMTGAGRSAADTMKRMSEL
jgi:hypothetical protein